jgi:hypothetical protein
MTADESWVSFVNVETKAQSKRWMHTHSSNKPESLNKRLSARKLMTAVFWDRKGMLMVEFMQQGTPVTFEGYCQTLKNCVVDDRVYLTSEMGEFYLVQYMSICCY